MLCRWCKGTGEECGCGEGHCVHCGGSGKVASPPFEAQLRNVLSSEQVSRLAERWCSRDQSVPMDVAWEKLTTDVARAAVNDSRDLHNGDAYQVLKPSVVAAFSAYWEHPCRDETLGQVIQRIAQYVVDHPAELVTRYWSDGQFLDDALKRINAMTREDLVACLERHGISFETLPEKGDTA